MKAFLINLDRDTERLAAADAQLRRLGIAYERVKAVDGKGLSRAEIRRNVARTRALWANGSMYTPGQIGCWLSHTGIYRRMLAERIPAALVLEDDVTLSEDAPRVIAFAEEAIDCKKPQWVLLSDHSRGHAAEVKASDEQPRLERIGYDFCTEAYIITQAAAKEILRVNDPMVVTCDSYPRWTKRGHIELYHAKPSVAIQNRADFRSNLGYDTIVRGRTGLRRLAWGAWRLYGHAMDELYFRLTGR